jgi:long-chain fatty acid transport protein
MSEKQQRNCRGAVSVALWLALAVGSPVLGPQAFGQGLYLGGAGPVSRAMGGASTAAPLDAAGAAYWNPAAISGLRQSEIMLGNEFIYPTIHLSSSVSANAFGPGLPPVDRAGSTRSDSGLSLVPALSWVHRNPDSPITFGLASFGSAGGTVNFPGDPNNPVLSPTLAGAVVLGPQYGNAQFLQIVPSLAYEVTDRLTIGFSPMVDFVQMQVDPAFFEPPDFSAGIPGTFPAATHSRPYWGAGFRAGMYYHLTSNLDVGFSYISPQWFETFEYNSRDALGNPQQLSLALTLPQIFSWGLAYKGIPRTLIATDFRFFDYKNTTLFGDPAPIGLGWNGVFATAVGAQYQLTGRTSLMAGYLYNQNPIPAANTLFNTQLPGILMHSVSFGASTVLTENIYLSLAYVHAFENSITGSPREVPEATVTMDAAADSLVMGIGIRYGCRQLPRVE